MVYAIIDTNIIVSSFITKNPSSSTRRVINSMLSGKYSVPPHISDTHMSFSPPPANTSGGYTLI